jgi:hypothetical protein
MLPAARVGAVGRKSLHHFDLTSEIVGIEKKVMVGRVVRSAYWLNHDPSGLVDSPKGWREIAGERECLHYKKEPRLTGRG